MNNVTDITNGATEPARATLPSQQATIGRSTLVSNYAAEVVMPKKLLIAIMLLILGGCSSVSSLELKPWVSPYERNNLSDPIMQWSRNPVASAYMKHVYEAREGARGADGGSGGGCGCN